MAIWDEWVNSISRKIAASVLDITTAQPIVKVRSYRQGYQKHQLKVKPNQFNDNLALNYVGLIESRIVSQMIGDGIEIDFEGDTETPQETYIKAALDANKQEVLLHRALVSAGEAGTGYIMVIPDGVVGDDGKLYPRLQLLDPAFVKMDTLPEDYEIVIRYTIEYRFTEDGKEKARRRIVERIMAKGAGDTSQPDGWKVSDFIQDGGRWQFESEYIWPYYFAPIIHWQNLPSVADCHGEPDITDNLIDLQDRINFVASNISKIIRLYAHPMRYGVNIGELKETDVGPDRMVRISGQDADIRQLEPLGDLASSLVFLHDLTRAFHVTARVIDLSLLEDKIGSVTNFGLRVLYQDNISMIATKRELFGDMLEELVKRLLILAGMPELSCKIVWREFLPQNPVEDIAAVKSKLEMGVMSKQTATGEVGLDWETEQERITAEGNTTETLGAALIRAFDQGRQAE